MYVYPLNINTTNNVCPPSHTEINTTNTYLSVHFFHTDITITNTCLPSLIRKYYKYYMSALSLIERQMLQIKIHPEFSPVY